ncbi:hypothetical protein [Arcobacter sp.]|uniref:hypothetical protein n=1 Tax=Arcobacter sp. TaxID=1872629 RepID=UPI003D11393E
MKYKIISIFIFLFIFTGCVTKIELPVIDNIDTLVKILSPIDGYYENAIGKEKKLIISNYEYNLKHNLLTWPKNKYKTICFSNKICLVDTLDKGYFTHSAVKGREKLFKLDKVTNYSILKKLLTINYIDNPKIYHNEKIVEGLKIIYIPLLNTISYREIGESMYEKINQFAFNTYITKVNQIISAHPIDEYGEEKYELNVNFNKDYKLMEWPEKNYKTICQNELCLINSNDGNYFTHYAIKNESKLYPLDEPIKYKLIQNILYNENSFKYQALYQGKVGNKIKISFREFKNDMARPAFTQDIIYELNSNKPTIIGFKGLRIKIIKATNLDITYSVIKDYK